MFTAIRRASSRVIVRCGAASCAAPVPLILKCSKGTKRVAKFRAAFLFAVHGVVTPQVACKNNSLLQGAKEIAQCARINVVAPAFLISTEGGCAVGGPPCGRFWNTKSRPLSAVRRRLK